MYQCGLWLFKFYYMYWNLCIPAKKSLLLVEALQMMLILSYLSFLFQKHVSAAKSKNQTVILLNLDFVKFWSTIVLKKTSLLLFFKSLAHFLCVWFCESPWVDPCNGPSPVSSPRGEPLAANCQQTGGWINKQATGMLKQLKPLKQLKQLQVVFTSVLVADH